MNERTVIAGSLLLAVVLTGAVSALTQSLAVVGGTPTGFAIYLVVGIGLPQYVLFRRTESPLRLGLAVLAIVSALTIVIGATVVGGLHDDWGVGITALFVVVVGVLLGAIWRGFAEGYQSASGTDTNTNTDTDSEPLE